MNFWINLPWVVYILWCPEKPRTCRSICPQLSALPTCQHTFDITPLWKNIPWHCILTANSRWHLLQPEKAQSKNVSENLKPELKKDNFIRIFIDYYARGKRERELFNYLFVNFNGLFVVFHLSGVLRDFQWTLVGWAARKDRRMEKRLSCRLNFDLGKNSSWSSSRQPHFHRAVKIIIFSQEVVIFFARNTIYKILIYTKLVNFTRLYFPHFTTFYNQTEQFYSF